MESAPGYWFTSTIFKVEPGEDEATNPRLYGRQLARWLRDKVSSLGYPVEEVIPEDWGWCVMCQREPYLLWIGCVNLRDHERAREGDAPPTQQMLLWNAVPMAELPLLRNYFRAKPNLAKGLSVLNAQLGAILNAEPGIQLYDESVTNTWFDNRLKRQQ